MRFSKIVEEKEEISRDNWMGGFAHMQLSEVVGFLWKEAPVCYHFFHMICNFFCQWWWLYVSAIKVFHSCPRGLQPFNIYESSNIFENVFFLLCFVSQKLYPSKHYFDVWQIWQRERKIWWFPKTFSNLFDEIIWRSRQRKIPGFKDLMKVLIFG